MRRTLPVGCSFVKALICDNYNGIDALRVGEFPDPEPTSGTVLISVEAASVNFADTLIVQGQYQVRPETPFVPGTELAGVVERADDIEDLSKGDRVTAYLGYGAIAERVVAFPGSILKLPDSVSFEEGATIPVAFGTSYHALVDRAQIDPGEMLLVLGAAGGVGLAAVQIGKALGATVIGAVSTEEKASAVLDAGADHVIRYDQTPLREGIATATDGAGVDVVYDPVGGEMTELALRSTKWNGCLLVVGFASGDIPSIPLNLSLVKGNSIVGVFWGRFTIEEPDQSRENNHQIMEWIAEGKLTPVVQKRYSLDEAVDALHWVANRSAIGRVIITP